MDVNERYANLFLKRFEKTKMVVITDHNYMDRLGWNLLVKRELIEHTGEKQFTITVKGLQVLDCGGWFNYLELEQLKGEKKASKEGFDFLISKFHAKSRFLPYIISILSIAIACAAYFKPIDKPSKQQLSIDEVIHIVDSISSSNQTKKVDSTHISKNLNQK